MASYLDELYAHQEWADAEHWRAFEAHATALADKAIRARLLHIHQVQYAYVWIAGTRAAQFEFRKIEDFPTMADLKQYARQGHAQMIAIVKAATEKQLDETLEIPWFQPPLKVSVRHALMQAAMHSHYHRGQNATRLRELGGEPPMTDFILWVRDGKPAAKWE